MSRQKGYCRIAKALTTDDADGKCSDDFIADFAFGLFASRAQKVSQPSELLNR
jgi:hypothetical protein